MLWHNPPANSGDMERSLKKKLDIVVYVLCLLEGWGTDGKFSYISAGPPQKAAATRAKSGQVKTERPPAERKAEKSRSCRLKSPVVG
jgi:hypothetical protein